jgi:VIT1/CCC1 family predicted Fe2+/Mn2+ transporter
VLEAQGLPEEEASPARHGLATFLAFVVAGALPLVPYVIAGLAIDRFTLSIGLTFVSMFGIGALRSTISTVRWWMGGIEMLALGSAVAAVAYWSGALVARAVGGQPL